MKRVLTPKDIDAMVFDHFDFQGEWFDAFDKPETSGTWFIWGDSGNGKSSFVQKLIKYLSSIAKVLVAPLEEGGRSTLQKAFRKINMASVGAGRLQVCPREPITTSIERLRQRRNPAKVFVIDSWQYANLTFNAFKKLTEEFPEVLFIVISQSKKNAPIGLSAERVMLHADLKILVQGHRAISKGRYIGTKGYYTNWIEGAAKYWGMESIS